MSLDTRLESQDGISGVIYQSLRAVECFYVCFKWLSITVDLMNLICFVLQKLGSCLDKAIAKGSLPKNMSSFQDLISASVDLLEDLCENQLAQPYLKKAGYFSGFNKSECF